MRLLCASALFDLLDVDSVVPSRAAKGTVKVPPQKAFGAPTEGEAKDEEVSIAAYDLSKLDEALKQLAICCLLGGFLFYKMNTLRPLFLQA